MTTILGAGKDKDGHMAVVDYKVEIISALSEENIKTLFGLSGCEEGFSAGRSYESALTLVSNAILALIASPGLVINSNPIEQDNDLQQSQIVLNDLISIRGSIINSKRAGYEDYAIQIL